LTQTDALGVGDVKWKVNDDALVVSPNVEAVHINDQPMVSRLTTSK